MGSLDSQLPNFQLGGGRAGRGREVVAKSTKKMHTKYTQIIQQQKIQKYKKKVIQKTNKNTKLFPAGWRQSGGREDAWGSESTFYAEHELNTKFSHFTLKLYKELQIHLLSYILQCSKEYRKPNYIAFKCIIQEVYFPGCRNIKGRDGHIQKMCAS